jgi:predicted small lipoprotein YifL
MMRKAARLLAALAVVLATLTGCGDLYCGVPKAPT